MPFLILTRVLESTVVAAGTPLSVLLFHSTEEMEREVQKNALNACGALSIFFSHCCARF